MIRLLLAALRYQQPELPYCARCACHHVGPPCQPAARR